MIVVSFSVLAINHRRPSKQCSQLRVVKRPSDLQSSPFSHRSSLVLPGPPWQTGTTLCKDVPAERTCAQGNPRAEVRGTQPSHPHDISNSTSACLTQCVATRSCCSPRLCFFFLCGIGEISHATLQSVPCRFISCPPSKNNYGPRLPACPKSRMLAVLETLTMFFKSMMWRQKRK